MKHYLILWIYRSNEALLAEYVGLVYADEALLAEYIYKKKGLLIIDKNVLTFFL